MTVTILLLLALLVIGIDAGLDGNSQARPAQLPVGRV